MPRQKGKKRDYCSEGHRLELPVGLNWMKDVNEKNEMVEFRIRSLYTGGLVAKKVRRTFLLFIPFYLFQ